MKTIQACFVLAYMYMRLLELCSSTGSVGSAFASAGWDVVSLDSDPKTEATIHEDILTWDRATYPPRHFDVIWSSPCCAHCSRARRGAKTPRNLVWADSLVIRTLANYRLFSTSRVVYRKPQTRMLKDRGFMDGKPYADLDYCCYCSWGYRKRTRLWSNVNFTGKLCPGPGSCQNMENGKHKTKAQQGRNRCNTGLRGAHFAQQPSHKIPQTYATKLF